MRGCWVIAGMVTLLLGCPPGSHADPTTGETSSTSGVVDPTEAPLDSSSTSDAPPSSSDSTGSDATGSDSTGSSGQPPPACGDGTIDPGEECDDGEDNAPSGACLPGCVQATCGDGELLAATESCDGRNLGDQDCGSLGFDGGTLACDAACSFDTTGCHVCGDGMPGGAEACDGAVPVEATCESVLGPQFHGTLACDPACGFDTGGCHECGDGLVDPGELCDGAELDGASCESVLGPQFHGTLACDAACGLDTAGCHECGDGSIDPGEACDGAQLGGSTCAGLGFDGGVVACDATCQLDTSGCHECGNGVREASEACDGTDFGGDSCFTLAPNPIAPFFSGGPLVCDAACTIDTSQCSVCGNGMLEDGEECDGADFGGESCADLYPSRIEGNPICLPGCFLHPTQGCCIPDGNPCSPGNNVCCSGYPFGCALDLLICL